MTSAKYGLVSFSFEALSNSFLNCDYGNNATNNVDLFLEILDSDFLGEVDLNDPGLLYITGYASFKVKQQLSCVSCQNFIVSNEESPNEYFDSLNRGGLTVPSDIVVNAGAHMYGIMNCLISEGYERDFLQSSSQQKLLLDLSIRSLEENPVTGDVVNSNCVCGEKKVNTIMKILKPMSNVLLNNYCKIRNSLISANKVKKRKLQTLL